MRQPCSALKAGPRWIAWLLAAVSCWLVPPLYAQDSGVLAAGDSHTCIVLQGGAMKCWGRQEQDQLAAGSSFYSTGTPVDVLGIDDALRVSGGYQFTCVLLQDGRIKCFGYNRFGQVGRTSNTCRVDEGAGECALVEGVENAVDVAAGGSHACAATSGGSVYCWGLNNHGQLGQGIFGGGTDGANPPMQVPGITTAFAVAAGASFSCALVGNGEVRCWGRDQRGQLGDGSATADPGQASPTAVAGITDAVAIAAGDAHACVLHAGGGVSCWGHQDYGALGAGDDPNNAYWPSPRTLAVNDAVAVVAGDYHTCVQHADDSLSCFGHNYYGQVGNGTNRNNQFFPVGVVGVGSASALAAGSGHSCARVATDPVNVMCWGSGNMGQTGNGAVGGTNEHLDPRFVVGSPFDTIFGGRSGAFEDAL